MASRTDFKTLILELGGPLQTFSTAFSGEASLVSPATGEQLKVYAIRLDGNSGNTNVSPVEIRDGDGDPIATLYVPVGGERSLDFAGRFWPVNTSLRITKPAGAENDQVSVSVFYKTSST